MFWKKRKVPMFIIQKDCDVKVLKNKHGYLISTRDVNAVKFVGIFNEEDLVKRK